METVIKLISITQLKIDEKYIAEFEISNLTNKKKILLIILNNKSKNEVRNIVNHFGKSKVPDNVKDSKLYLKIKTKIQKDVKKKDRRWGAYDSGRLVREYKNLGGKYSGKKSDSKSNLNRWYREKWIDACSWPKIKSCGRTKDKIKSKVTYCRPSKKIDSNTPKIIQELTKPEIKRLCEKKNRNPKKIIR